MSSLKSLRILIAGGSGFIGSALRQRLHEQGHHLVTLGRTRLAPSRTLQDEESMTWDELGRQGLPDVDAVVQLTGANIMAEKWTPERKRELLASRVDVAARLVYEIGRADKKPSVLVQASAVGYYPTDQPNTVFDETYLGPPASSFAGELCASWEDVTTSLEPEVRRVIVRTGVVLAPKGGALAEMTLPFGLAYVSLAFSPSEPICSASLHMGTIGSGAHYFPWVHMDDLCSIYQLSIENPDVTGVLNGVAPHLTSQSEFSKTLSRVFHRIAVPVPKKVVELMFGERAILLTEGQKVWPKRVLEEYHMEYRFPTLEAALNDIKQKQGK